MKSEKATQILLLAAGLLSLLTQLPHFFLILQMQENFPSVPSTVEASVPPPTQWIPARNIADPFRLFSVAVSADNSARMPPNRLFSPKQMVVHRFFPPVPPDWQS